MALALAVQTSAAGVFRASQPELALKFAPFDSTARAKQASRLVSGFEPSDRSRAAARRLALDAIRRDPIQPQAFRALAGAADSARPGDHRRALALMLEVNRLSRRDLAAQLWLIQDYARRRDYPVMMKHFEIAFRTSPRARLQLFPLLDLMSTQPVIKGLLIRDARGGADWALPFVRYLISSGQNLELAAQLAPALLDLKIADERALFLTLLGRLTDQGNYRLAEDLYKQAGLATKNDAGLVSNGGFENAPAAAPFAWQFTEEAELWASPDGGGNHDGRRLRVFASQGRSGVVARQLLHLSPRRYELRAQVGAVASDQFERIEFQVVCAGREDGAVLAQVKPTRPGEGPFWIAARLSVSARCPYQWLRLAIGGSTGQAGRESWVDNVSITPAAD